MSTPRLSLIDEQTGKKWRRMTLRGLIERRRQTGFQLLPLLSANLPVGVVVRKSGDGRVRPSLDLTRYQLVEPGDLVVNPLGKPHGSLGVSRYRGITSPAYFVARVRPSAFPRFLHYLMRTRLYISEYERVGKYMPPSQFDISWKLLTQIPVYLPPLPTQRAIADFLDRETDRIDQLVEKKRRLIELLREKRTALISHAVTKGLDPTVPMKDSGIPWLGEIPEAWEFVPFRRVIHGIDQGSSPNAEDRTASSSEWGVLKLSAIGNGRFLESEHKTLPPTVLPDPRHTVKAGDLLLTRANTPKFVGRACVVERVRDRLQLPDLVYRLHVRPDVAQPRFIALWLGSSAGRFQIERDARGSSQSMVKISQGHIRSWLMTVPPFNEQVKLTSKVDNECQRIESVSALVGRQLGLLVEYRQALITAAVTGQLDIKTPQPDPEAVAP